MVLSAQICAQCGKEPVDPAAPLGVCTRCLTDLLSSNASTSSIEDASDRSLAATPDVLRPGMRLAHGRYELVELRGRGGQGQVWLARDHKLGGDDSQGDSSQSGFVALKFLAPEIRENERALRALRREVLLGREFRHPNIVAIYDWHEFAREPVFIAMEFVEGEPLSRRLRRQSGGYFSWTNLRPLAKQLCDAVYHVHARGRVHCDIKPSNLIISADGILRLVDLGLARFATEEGGGASAGGGGGTLPYMSPQRRLGHDATKADDIYAVGATLHELLAGAPPPFPTRGAAVDQAAWPNPPSIADELARRGPCDVPPEVQTTIRACLEFYPQRRPTAYEVERQLGLLPGPSGPEANRPIGVPLRANAHVGAGRFLLQQCLGENEMGQVWVAWDREIGKHFALRFLPPSRADDPEFLTRLRRGIVRTQDLKNEHIVGILDLVAVPGEIPFLKMEYVPGRNLEQRRQGYDGQVMPWDELAPLIPQLCAALEHAHERGIVHGDIKPSNLVVDGLGQLKLVEFGMPSSRGTEAFTSPQRLSGTEPEPRDDLYSVGATLYKLLTGEPPFVGELVAARIVDEPVETLQERRRHRGIAGEIPGRVSMAVMRCLAKDPDVRPRTAKELARLLGPPGGAVRRDPKPPPPPTYSSAAKPASGTPNRQLPEISIPARALSPAAPILPIPELHAASEDPPVVIPALAEVPEPSATPAVPPLVPLEAPPVADHSAAPDRAEEVAYTLFKVLALAALLVAAAFLAHRLIDPPVPSPDTASQASSNSIAVPIAESRPPPSSPSKGSLEITTFDLGSAGSATRTVFAYRIDREGQEIASGFAVHADPTTVELEPGDYDVAISMPGGTPEGAGASRRMTNRVLIAPDLKSTLRFDFAEATRSVTQSTPSVPETPIPGRPWTRRSLRSSRPAVTRFAWLESTALRAWLALEETTLGDYREFAKEHSVGTGLRVAGPEGWTSNEALGWENPGFRQEDQHPVVGVSWREARAYCDWLTKTDRAEGLLSPTQAYRLPTSAEIAFAARDLRPGPGSGNLAGRELQDGTTGLTQGLWHPLWPVLPEHRDPYPATSPVGSFPRNSNGFADLIGNAAEWCEDWFTSESNEPELRQSSRYFGTPVPANRFKVVVGGSWYHESLRDADPKVRSRFDPEERFAFIGFRLALEENPQIP